MLVCVLHEFISTWYYLSYSGTINISLYQINGLFFRNGSLFSFGHGSFIVLSAAGPAGGRRGQHGASVGSGRAPWPMLHMVKVT